MEDDLGLIGIGAWGLRGRYIPEEAGILRPSLLTLEDVRKPARKGKHFKTFRFGISNFQFCIIAVYKVVFSPLLGNYF